MSGTLCETAVVVDTHRSQPCEFLSGSHAQTSDLRKPWENEGHGFTPAVCGSLFHSIRNLMHLHFWSLGMLALGLQLSCSEKPKSHGETLPQFLATSPHHQPAMDGALLAIRAR